MLNFKTGYSATDLDGTLIPLAGNSQNRTDLARLKAELKNHNVGLVFVTGRDFPAVEYLISLHDLPVPDYLICDVGTSIYHKENEQFQINREYHEYQMQIVGSMTTQKTYDLVKSVEGLELQEEEKQGDFKLSFYVEASRLSGAVSEMDRLVNEANAPYEITESIDPFNGIGLVDLLPKNVSKAGALKWWSEYHQLSPGSIVFGRGFRKRFLCDDIGIQNNRCR